MGDLEMNPPAGERLVSYVGDRLRFTLSGAPDLKRVFLRTNIGRAAAIRAEIISQIQEPKVQVETSWRDVPMRMEDGKWVVEFALTEVGWLQAKPYGLDDSGQQHWPAGENVGLSVHPNDSRSANTIYCCFPRMFGPNKTARETASCDAAEHIQKLDHEGYSVIPPSGTFRDVIAELPHIMGKLGCRILHLLPVNSTPTTYARMGRFGSPYACGDLTDIDPALLEFDKRTTGVQQFCELTDAVHARDGRLFLDLVINHTGWGSTLQENHPEWFLREDNGEFASPGAWGNTWGDLVELEPHHRGLWEHLAEAFLTWCRRGVDGFRCDAGYKVPMPVWRYIIARVREEFPDTVFLLEGLGGGWDDTENLLTRGGMQWAYSELFQEYNGDNISGYLDHALLQSPRIGTLIHYSETHDNSRLAGRGRTWSLMRNRLSALTSINGGYGFTNGVEWLADEQVNVHNARGMAWGSEENLVSELSRLNELLKHHSCFRDGAKFNRISHRESPVFALERLSACGQQVLVLVNSDPDSAHELQLSLDAVSVKEDWVDLLGGESPNASWENDHVHFLLQPGQVHCLAPGKEESKSDYRVARARVAWAMQCLAANFEPEEIGSFDWEKLSELIARKPGEFLAAIRWMNPCANDLFVEIESAMKRSAYPNFVTWRSADATRVFPVPHGHWLLLRDERPFRASLGEGQHVESVPVAEGHVAAFQPNFSGELQLTMRRLDERPEPIHGQLLFLGDQPSEEHFDAGVVRSDLDPIESPIALLTNGRGGMARMGVDLGNIKSKYDCLLAANLDDSLPVDRHVFAKRVRVWAVADGFITPLNADNLLDFYSDDSARWKFLVSAGDNRTVQISLTATMPPGENATLLEFERIDSDPEKGVALERDKSFFLTVRVDIEDRSFHSETKLTDAAYQHFENHSTPLEDEIGFSFEPRKDSRFVVRANKGRYHHEFEWSCDIQHSIEASRGQVESGDACSPGWFRLPLEPGEQVNVVCAVDSLSAPEAGWVEENGGNTFSDRLKGSLNHFVVQRGAGKTVIAGYPWFLDWGRDTLIVARGMLAAGMVSEVTDIIKTFAALEENGTLPNSLRGDDASNRDTSDAPLWFGVVCAELASQGIELTEIKAKGRAISDVLESIASNYRDGIPNGIRMDPETGLIWSPTHFTWMDTNYPAGSPREGYPVEIQALWLRLLRHLGVSCDEWEELRAQAKGSFNSLYQIETDWLSDLLIGDSKITAQDARADNALRSNALLAIALGEVDAEMARKTVAAAQRFLVVPGAVRSLAPLPVEPPLPVKAGDGSLLNNPDKPYWGRYEGDEDTHRKPAYHNGTAWVWTLPMFCEALVRAWDYSPESIAAARSYLLSMETLLNKGCVGNLPEVLDGDAPHQQRGCDAQAWSASEAYRVWDLLESKNQNQKQNAEIK